MDVEDKPCRRGCCWTPYGHSTIRDGIPKTSDKACRCHTPLVLPKPDLFDLTLERMTHE